MKRDADRYLLFSLAGRLMALNLLQVAEVCEPCRLWPVPAAPPCVRGAMNHQGSIVAVVELAVLLGLSGEGTTEKLIVLHQKGAALAFPTERVLRIVPAGQVASREEGNGPCSRGEITLPEGVATLLDGALIVEMATELMHAPPTHPRHPA